MAEVPPVSAGEELSEAVMLLKRFRKALDVSFGDDAALEAVLAINKRLTEAEDDAEDANQLQSELDDANENLEKAENRLAELCDPSHRGMVQKIATNLFTHGGVACKLFREDGSEVDAYEVEQSLKELFTSEGVYDGCP